MKLFQLFFLPAFVISIAPMPSSAQMQTQSSNNMSGQTRASNGKVHTIDKINRVMVMDGQSNNQSVTFTMATEGEEGPIRDIMTQSLEQMRSGEASSIEQLNLGTNKEGELIRMANSAVITEEGFSISATMTISEQDFDMYQRVEEEITFDVLEEFSSVTNSESFSTGTGFDGAFD